VEAHLVEQAPCTKRLITPWDLWRHQHVEEKYERKKKSAMFALTLACNYRNMIFCAVLTPFAPSFQSRQSISFIIMLKDPHTRLSTEARQCSMIENQQAPVRIRDLRAFAISLSSYLTFSARV
jgi:hypothetical protein